MSCPRLESNYDSSVSQPLAYRLRSPITLPLPPVTNFSVSVTLQSLTLVYNAYKAQLSAILVKYFNITTDKSYCSTVHFRRITSIHQPTNAHIISHKTLLKHFKTLRHVSILSDHHQGALFLAKVILRYSQFNSYLQMRCCGSISCCVAEQWLGVRRIRRTPSHCCTTHSHTT